MKCRFGKDKCYLVESQKGFLEEIESVITGTSSGIPKSGNVIVYGPPGMGRYFLLECLENHLNKGCMNKPKAEEKKTEAVLIPIPPVIDYSSVVVIVLKNLTQHMYRFIYELIEDKEEEIEKITNFFKEWKWEEGITDSEKELLLSIPKIIRILLRCEASLNYTTSHLREERKEKNFDADIQGEAKAKIKPDSLLRFLPEIFNIGISGKAEVGFNIARKFLETELNEFSVSFEPFTVSQAIYYLDEICRLLSTYATHTKKRVVVILGCERLSAEITEKLLLAIGSAVRFSRSLSFIVACDLQFYLKNRVRAGFLKGNSLDFTAHIALPYPVLKMEEIAKIISSSGKNNTEPEDFLSALLSGGKISNAKACRVYVEKMFKSYRMEENVKKTFCEAFKMFQDRFENEVAGKERDDRYQKEVEFHLARLFLYRFFYLIFLKKSPKIHEIIEDEFLQYLSSLIGKEIYPILSMIMHLPLEGEREVKLPVTMAGDGSLKIDIENYIKYLERLVNRPAFISPKQEGGNG